VPRRKKPARLPKLKQKKATLSSPVISPDDIITCTALVGDWTITATCKRSESEQCMTELQEQSSGMKECTACLDFFDPTPEQQNVVLINTATVHEAERLIESCECCNPEGAEIPLITFSTALPAQIPA